MTIGIVCVARLAARMAGVPVARMISTGMRTSSVAIEGNRSGCPSADRYSRTNCRCSTYPSSSRPRRNAASCAAFELAARASMMPMRYRRDSGCAAPVARAVVARAAANPPPTHPRNVLRVNMSSARWRQDATDRRRSSIGAMLLRSSFDHGCVGKLAHETFEAPKVIECEGLGRIGRRVSRLVLLRYLELCVAVGVEGDGDEIRPAAYCTVLGVDLPRATTGIHEGVVLLAAVRARVGHGFSLRCSYPFQRSANWVATTSSYLTCPSRAPISRANRLMWVTISSLMVAS